jgi:hypothetical protein
MKKLFFLACFSVISSFAHSQVSLSYYPVSSYIGVSSDPYKRVWADFRMLTNTFISNTNMELSPMLNLKNDSVVRCYVGIGVNFNIIYGWYNQGRYVNGYSVTLGSRVSPFRQARNLSFIAEFSPYVNGEFSGATLRTNLGISWRFTRKHRG